MEDKKNITKDSIIETTLSIISENEGIKDVNLRGLAKKLGCAHTNLYNYYYNINEILWDALGQVMLRMIAYVDTNIDKDGKYTDAIEQKLMNIITFSINNRGWYRLIWLENIQGEPSPGVKDILQMPGRGFRESILKNSGNKLSETDAGRIAHMVTVYLHGELSRWINSRGNETDTEKVREAIYSNTKYLYNLLIS